MDAVEPIYSLVMIMILKPCCFQKFMIWVKFETAPKQLKVFTRFVSKLKL